MDERCRGRLADDIAFVGSAGGGAGAGGNDGSDVPARPSGGRDRGSRGPAQAAAWRSDADGYRRGPACAGDTCRCRKPLAAADADGDDGRRLCACGTRVSGHRSRTGRPRGIAAGGDAERAGHQYRQINRACPCGCGDRIVRSGCGVCGQRSQHLRRHRRAVSLEAGGAGPRPACRALHWRDASRAALRAAFAGIAFRHLASLYLLSLQQQPVGPASADRARRAGAWSDRLWRVAVVHGGGSHSRRIGNAKSQVPDEW